MIERVLSDQNGIRVLVTSQPYGKLSTSLLLALTDLSETENKIKKCFVFPTNILQTWCELTLSERMLRTSMSALAWSRL